MRANVERWERRQVPLYLAALVLGAVVGVLMPGVARPAELAITPVLGLLLYVTFLGVPLDRLGRAVRDGRFLLTLLVVNVGVVPLVAFALSRLVAHDPALEVGLLLVLLAPCVDYVIVFTGLAGGAQDRLLAAAPVLMLVQLVSVPVGLRLIVRPGVVADVDLAPFARAFLLLLVVPLVAAALTRALARRTRAGRLVRDGMPATMVPLMMLTLAAVVASQIAGVERRLGSLLPVIGACALFAAIMLVLGVAAGRVARLDVPARRALALSGMTRNSLVVLPLALALPAHLDLAPLVVVAQTLVELLVMVAAVRLVPWMIPLRERRPRAGRA